MSLSDKLIREEGMSTYGHMRFAQIALLEAQTALQWSVENTQNFDEGLLTQHARVLSLEASQLHQSVIRTMGVVSRLQWRRPEGGGRHYDPKAIVEGESTAKPVDDTGRDPDAALVEYDAAQKGRGDLIEAFLDAIKKADESAQAQPTAHQKQDHPPTAAIALKASRPTTICPPQASSLFCDLCGRISQT